ncbi:hypothetical protein QJS66_08290 [Kocuria rhizophila]|nr:hypothetical protein QJS66_08290 [Kocuria rhizophila]
MDLLVNNAGFGSHGEFATLDPDRELEELTVNVRALMTLTLRGAVHSRPPPAAGQSSHRLRGGVPPLPSMATQRVQGVRGPLHARGGRLEARKHGVRVLSVIRARGHRLLRRGGRRRHRPWAVARPEDLAAADLPPARTLAAGAVAPRAYHVLERITGLVPHAGAGWPTGCRGRS